MPSSRLGAGSASAIVLSLVVACAPVIDAPIPPGYRDLVESARTSLLGNFEGLGAPSFALVRIRCFANGGMVILFRQVGGPTPGEPAFAMGGGPGAVAGIWSGGYGDMASIEQEIEFNFGNIAEVLCPARGG